MSQESSDEKDARIAELEALLAKNEHAIEFQAERIMTQDQELAEAKKKERSVETRLKAADELVGILRRHLRASSSDPMPDDIRRSLSLSVRTYRDARKGKTDE